MNTCGDCSRRPAAGSAPRWALQKGVRKGPLRWKAPRALEGRRIDVHRREWAHTTGPLRRRVSRLARSKHRRPREVSEGSIRRSDRKPTKRRRFTQPRAKAREWQPNGPKPASRRQARSCWRSDDRKVVRRRPRNGKRPSALALQQAISSRTSAGFPRRSAESLQR